MFKRIHIFLLLALAATGCVTTKQQYAQREHQTRRRGLLFDQEGLAWPVMGRVSSSFGRRWGRAHQGVDIRAPRGTPILAASEGRVEFSGWISGYGKTVIVANNNFKTLYAHCSSIRVRKNTYVEKGQVIAAVGSTGNASGAHLHFEYRDLDDKPFDPLLFLDYKERIARR
jgi:murein DD-endopeptidase MepM/ murein hydrolase activator NlpD